MSIRRLLLRWCNRDLSGGVVEYPSRAVHRIILILSMWATVTCGGIVKESPGGSESTPMDSVPSPNAQAPRDVIPPTETEHPGNSPEGPRRDDDVPLDPPSEDPSQGQPENVVDP